MKPAPMKPAVIVENISKVYKLYEKPRDRLKEVFHPFHKVYHRDFRALSNVSFQVKKGETLGVVGQNGAGKSTLLKIIAGILSPSSGRVQVNGKPTMLELGSGFNPQMTGVENIYFNGMLRGFTKKEMKSKLDDILEFADIGNFAYQRVRTLSSGMFSRLAFAAAVHIDPEILIVDETLSVGDAYFSVKSMNKMRELMSSGCTVLFVSHNPQSIRAVCDRAILIDQGKLVESGTPADVMDLYQNIILRKIHQKNLVDKTHKEPSATTAKPAKKEPEKGKDRKPGGVAKGANTDNPATGEAELVSLCLYNEKGDEIAYIVSEEKLKAVFTVKALKDIEEPHFGLTIRDKYGNPAFATTTYHLNMQPASLKKGQLAEVVFEYDFNLQVGVYSLDVGVANYGYDNGLFKEYLLYQQRVEVIKVIQNPDLPHYQGYYNMRPRVNVINK